MSLPHVPRKRTANTVQLLRVERLWVEVRTNTCIPIRYQSPVRQQEHDLEGACNLRPAPERRSTGYQLWQYADRTQRGEYKSEQDYLWLRKGSQAHDPSSPTSRARKPLCRTSDWVDYAAHCRVRCRRVHLDEVRNSYLQHQQHQLTLLDMHLEVVSSSSRERKSPSRQGLATPPP